ncbi:MAG: S8 family serine peptidase [Nitrospirota bacterium]
MLINRLKFLAVSAFAASVVSSLVSAQGPAGVARPEISIPAASQTVNGAGKGGASESRKAYFLQMSDAPAASSFAKNYERYFAESRFVIRGSQDEIKGQATERAAGEATQQAWAIDNLQRELVSRLVSKEFNVQVLYRAQTALNGIAVLADPSQVKALSTLPGVVRVNPMVPAQMDAVSSVNFIGARNIWNTAGVNAHGEGVGAMVIDSGNDFVHTGNGGPGGSSYNANITTVDGLTPATTFPTSKVIWGYDLCGDAYSAGVTNPVPDPNPMDTNGHGTACASLIGGFGVNSDGTAYSGAYDSINPDISAMRISPGIAPRASMYSLRVFGTSGSTDLVEQALDVATAVRLWQLSPVGTPLPPAITNLNPAPVTVPRTPVISVINMSLGSSNGVYSPYDTSSVATQNAANAGISVIISAGNSYDSYYVVGSPSVATASISVAATFNDKQPGLTATAPANGTQPALNLGAIVGTAAIGITTAANSLPPTLARYANPPLADFLYDPDNITTAALQNDAGQPVTDPTGLPTGVPNPYPGKVVLIDRGVVTFSQKSLAAARAGAAAIVIVNNRPGDAPGMAATAGVPAVTIPVVSVSQPDGANFSNTGAPNTQPARPNLAIAISPENPAGADAIASYSSRGIRRLDNRLKPDMAAPAENVTVNLAGSGNGVGGFNGTSSAAPHVSGSMTLLRQVTNSASATPNWSMEELKALMMNSATGNPLVGGVNGTIRFGLARVGLGRLNLNPAGGVPTAVALSTDAEFPVSVSFGTVEAPVGSTTIVDKTFKVVNKQTTGSARTFNLSFDTVTPAPGVSFSFPDGPSVTAAPGSSTTVRIRLTANGSALRHARDLSTSAQQVFSIGTPPTTPPTLLPRIFPSEAAGNIILTESGGAGQSMRLSVHSIPRPNSALAVTPAAFSLPVAPGTQTFTFSGTGINTGANVDTVINPVADIQSHAKGFELQFNQPASNETDPFFKSAEIRQVGVTTDVPRRIANGINPYATTPTLNTQSGVVVFAVTTTSDFNTPSSEGTDVEVLIDTNGNGAEEFVLSSLAWNDPTYGAGTSGSNMYLSATHPPGSAIVTATGYSTNIVAGRANNMLNNNIVMLPVDLQRLGISAAGNKRLNYKVRATFYYGTFVSETPWLTYDVSQPGLDASSGTAYEPFVFTAAPAGTLPVAVNRAYYQANRSLGMLMVYPHNGPGTRVQTVLASNRLFISDLSPASGPVGTQVTITGSGFTGATSVSFGTVPVPGAFTVVSDTQIRTNVPAGATTATIRVTTPAGVATSERKFGVTP